MELEELYQLYFKDVYYFIYGMCKNKAVAEDITSETFLKALKHESTKVRNIRAWLFTIAKNSYFTYIEREKIYVGEEIDIFSDVNILEDAISSDNLLFIHRNLHILNEPYKEVFMLRVFGELSFENIGIIFQKSDNWARVTYYRAKKQIIKLMEDNSDEEL